MSIPIALRRVRTVLLAALFVAAAFGPAQPALTRLDAPAGCITPTIHETIYAVELPPTAEGDVRLGYGLTPDSASIPGPTIELVEGDCLALTLVNLVAAETLQAIRDEFNLLLNRSENDLPLGVSLHVHGVKYTQSSDGTYHSNSTVPPGGSRTYTWYAAPRITTAGRVTSQGTAGYWWYHDHAVGTTHGSGGASSGLFGGLVVRRAEDVRPDKTFVVGMGPDATLNLRTYPETDCDDLDDPTPSNSCYVADLGERVEFLVIGFGNEFHSFHLHGHNWADNRTGILTTLADDTRLIDNKTVGPADTFGFQVVAGEEVGTGSWMLHCHVQSHSDRGMSTFFHVRTADGIVPGPAVDLAGGHLH